MSQISNIPFKLIRVDLSKSDVSVEDIPSSVLSRFLGGGGLGVYLFNKFHVDNPLVISLSPLTYVNPILNSRIVFTFKSPLTNLTTTSCLDNPSSLDLVLNGYLAILITGSSESPKYLYLDDGDVVLKDASNLWGLNTEETYKQLSRELGNVSVLCIGPAGEQLVKFSTLICYSYDGVISRASEAGLGALLGSMNLKAIVIKRFKKRSSDTRSIKPLRQIASKITPIDIFSVYPKPYESTYYWMFGECREYINLSYLEGEFERNSYGCYGCPVKCIRNVILKMGLYNGLQTTEPNYEALLSVFCGLGLSRYSDIIALSYICDLYGLDIYEFTSIASLIIQAFKLGRIKLSRVIKFNSLESALWILESIINGGVLREFKEGVGNASRLLDLEDIVLDIYNSSPPRYDPRYSKTIALLYIPYLLSLESKDFINLCSIDYLNKYHSLDNPIEYLTNFEDIYVISNSLALCIPIIPYLKWRLLQDIISDVLALDYDIEYLRGISNEILRLKWSLNRNTVLSKLEQIFNSRFFSEGFETLNGSVYRLDSEWFRNMLKEYRIFRGL